MPLVSHADEDGDSKRAKSFFDAGRAAADMGNFEYAIEQYLRGLSIDPENIDAHQSLREISLKRTASGGKPMGMLMKMKMPHAKDGRTAMLNAEKLLAYEPGNIDHMLGLAQAAHLAGMPETTVWISMILKGNTDR